MAEIVALPWNERGVVSTFSGGGGSCLGYRMAGYRVLWANEFIPAAAETYRANHPDSILDTRDIRQVKPEEILEAIDLKPGELDLFDGSPPCDSFSTAGIREKGWGKIKQSSETRQRTDDLFFEYARLLRGLKPKVFVAENVSGLVKGTAKGYFLKILAELKGCGYRVEAKLLDAQWLGVPQARQRIIFIGVREDLGLPPAFPKPLPYRYSVRDAIPWLSRVTGRTGPRFARTDSEIDQPMNAILVSDPEQTRYEVESETDISRCAIGAEWEKLAQGQKSERYLNLVRPYSEVPCPTITAVGGSTSLASVTHPTEKRKFSIAELKRICAFPDDFTLTGSFAQQWERLGNAVPPLMMKSIAETIYCELFDFL